jgi:nucleotide-binding universal stress UspA family protein
MNEQTTVVASIDEGPGSRAVITLAAEEARCRDARLVAVMAISSNLALGTPAVRPMAAHDRQLMAEATLRGMITDALGDQADQVTLLTTVGPTGQYLVAAAREGKAELIVLAGHGAASTLPGSTDHYVLRKAPCPVLIIPRNP